MFQGRVVNRAEHFGALKAAIENAETHFFADTCFLVAIASLNVAARLEFATWASALTPARFHVPAWAAHEAFDKISNDVAVLTPMSEAASQFLSLAERLQVESRRFVDNAVAHGKASDRLDFLGRLDERLKSASELAHHLKKTAKVRVDETAEFLAEFINEYVIDSDIYSALPSLNAEHGVRLIGKHPPGFEDQDKDANKYGDLIIWKEIVAFCRENLIKSVVFLTNDNKKDWVYTPQSVLVGTENKPNSGKSGPKIILPQPLLVHELCHKNVGAALKVVNLQGLAHVLCQEIVMPMPSLWAAYQPLAWAPDGPRPTGPDEGGQDASSEHVPAGGEGGFTAPTTEVEDQARPSFDEIIQALKAAEPERVSWGASQIPSHWDTFTPEEEEEIGYALIDASAQSEAVLLVIRELVRSADVRRRRVFIGLFEGMYFTSDGNIRNKPIWAPLDDLFSVQHLDVMKPVIEHIQGKLSDHAQKFLALPDVVPQKIPLTLLGGRRHGIRQIEGLIFGSHSLMEDVLAEDERSFASLMGHGPIGPIPSPSFIKKVAQYFCVPVNQLELPLLRSEKVQWDPLAGFVQWGSRTNTRLR